jgi:hypothetical protein
MAKREDSSDLADVDRPVEDDVVGAGIEDDDFDEDDEDLDDDEAHEEDEE